MYTQKHLRMFVSDHIQNTGIQSKKNFRKFQSGNCISPRASRTMQSGNSPFINHWEARSFRKSGNRISHDAVETRSSSIQDDATRRDVGISVKRRPPMRTLEERADVRPSRLCERTIYSALQMQIHFIMRSQ